MVFNTVTTKPYQKLRTPSTGALDSRLPKINNAFYERSKWTSVLFRFDHLDEVEIAF